jgi:hypothetical protein
MYPDGSSEADHGEKNIPNAENTPNFLGFFVKQFSLRVFLRKGAPGCCVGIIFLLNDLHDTFFPPSHSTSSAQQPF